MAVWKTDLAVAELVLRGTAVYVAVLLLLRLGGKRQIGQMGTAEFVAILLISNAVQNAMNGGDNSLAGGLVLAATLIVLSVGFEWLTFRSKRWEAWLQGRPTLLIHNGKVLEKNLERELLNPRELHAMLRRQGVHELGEVQEAILESDGSLSLIRKSDPPRPPGA